MTDDLTAAIALLRGMSCAVDLWYPPHDGRAIALLAARDAVCVALEQAQQENKELAREALQLAGERTFILGNDIPETVERARAVLVQRARDTETALAEAQQDINHWHAHYDAAQAMWDQAQRENARVEASLAECMEQLNAAGLAEERAEALARTLARELSCHERLGPTPEYAHVCYLCGYGDPRNCKTGWLLALPAVQALLKDSSDSSTANAEGDPHVEPENPKTEGR